MTHKKMNIENDEIFSFRVDEVDRYFLPMIR